MTRTIKPMLAATYGDDKKHIQGFTYPVIGSPKIDGIRALIVDGVVQSRSGKAIPCPTVQRLFGRPELEGLDGELTIGPWTSKDLMQRTMAVMSSSELEPADLAALSFNIFDKWDLVAPFIRRYETVEAILAWQTKQAGFEKVELVPHCWINSEDELLKHENDLLDLGYEGLMVNNPNGMYKNGRAGKTGWELTKVKRFVDNEALIIGAHEMMHNDNVAFKDELGKTKRATLQENLRPAGVLGSLRLRVLNGTFEGVEFDCSGFTAAQRAELWQLHLAGGLVGLTGTFKHFEVTGAKDKPRQPVWKGLRAKEDVS